MLDGLLLRTHIPAPGGQPNSTLDQRNSLGPGISPRPMPLQVTEPIAGWASLVASNRQSDAQAKQPPGRSCHTASLHLRKRRAGRLRRPVYKLISIVWMPPYHISYAPGLRKGRFPLVPPTHRGQRRGGLRQFASLGAGRRVVAVPNILGDLPGAVTLTPIDVESLADVQHRVATAHRSQCHRESHGLFVVAFFLRGACQRGPSDQAAGTFSFAVLGDAPYGPLEEIWFRRVIRQLDCCRCQCDHPRGDILWYPCSDDLFRARLAAFQSQRHPLVYTPGKNEWMDCHERITGSYQPLERLKRLREIFYDDPTKSLGGTTIPVTVQAPIRPGRSLSRTCGGPRRGS